MYEYHLISFNRVKRDTQEISQEALVKASTIILWTFPGGIPQNDRTPLTLF
jgi:hypothetical protein